MTGTLGDLPCGFCVEFGEHDLCVVCELDGVVRSDGTGEYADGYCYLALFKDSRQGYVADKLGAWPRLMEVLFLHESWFRPVECLNWFFLKGRGLMRHLVILDTPCANSVMECVWSLHLGGVVSPRGSYFSAIVNYWGPQDMEVSYRCALMLRMGGIGFEQFSSQFGSLPVVDWSGSDAGSKQCYRAYMEAYVAYVVECGAGGSGQGVEPYQRVRALLCSREEVEEIGVGVSGLCDSVSSASGEECHGAEKGASCQSGPSGDGVLGENTLRNRQWRRDKKERKHRKQERGSRWSSSGGRPVASGGGFFDGCSEETRRVLRETRAERLSVQNRLEKAKAERQLELLNASDLELEKKRHSTQVKAQTEKNMAAIERTHAYLSSTGNVPGEGILHHDHDVHTVVGSVPGSSANLSGSISPNSSASQAEFLACQKKLFDSEKLIRDMSAAFKKLGISFEAAGALDKQTFTDTPENAMIVDELYPDDHGVVHYVQRGDQRKFKVGPDDYYEG